MKITNSDILEYISEVIDRVDENMPKWNYIFEEEKYKYIEATFTLLNAVNVLRKCFDGMNIEVSTGLTAKGCYIITYDKTIFLSVEKAEDILLAGHSIASDFLFDILKVDLRFKRKLKLQKINGFKNS